MLIAYFRALRARGTILRALQRLLHLLGESVDAHASKLMNDAAEAIAHAMDRVAGPVASQAL